MDNLVTIARWIFKRIKPNVDSGLNVSEEVVKHHTTNSKQGNTDKNITCATCCDIEHDDKKHKEEQCATKIALEDNNNQTDAPHDKQWQKHLETRNAERSYRTHGD